MKEIPNNFITYIESIKYHKKPRVKESKRVLNALADLKKLFLDNFAPAVELIDMYTTGVYPRCAFDKGNKNYLVIWDSHYWDLYSRFIYLITFFYESNNESFDLEFSNNKELLKLVKDCTTSLALQFLSIRFDKEPALSYAFAYIYKMKYSLSPRYNTGGNIEELLIEVGHISEVDYAKMFVLGHELGHIEYNQESETRENFMDAIRTVCGLLNLEAEKKYKSSNKHTEDFDTALRNYSKSEKVILSLETYSLTSYVLENKEAQEEIYCDVTSILTIHKYLTTELKDKTEILFVLEKQRYWSIFQMWLKAIESYWRQNFELHCGSYPSENFLKDFEGQSKDVAARNSLVWSIVYNLLGENPSLMDFGEKTYQTEFIGSKLFRNEFLAQIMFNVSNLDIIREAFLLYDENKNKPEEALLKARNKMLGWEMG